MTSRSKCRADLSPSAPPSARVTAPSPAPRPRLVRTLDNGPIHTSQATQEALAPRALWLAVEWLSIEPVWRDLKEHRLTYQTFADAHGFETDDLETAIHRAVGAISNKPRRYPLAKLRISA